MGSFVSQVFGGTHGACVQYRKHPVPSRCSPQRLYLALGNCTCNSSCHYSTISVRFGARTILTLRFHRNLIYSQFPLGVLVVTEHFRSITPSSLVISYTLVKTIFTSAVLRTYVKIELFTLARNAAVLASLSTASYVLLFCLELIEKRRLLQDQVRIVE